MLDLFAGRRQLIVYRFFYAPDVEGWPEEGCTGCSLFADSTPRPAHLNARDTTFAFVSAAPPGTHRNIPPAHGWSVPWYTLIGDDFSRDFGVEEMFGLNVFIRNGDQGVPHVLRQRARCRDSRPRVDHSRSHPARPPRDLGELPGWAPAGRTGVRSRGTLAGRLAASGGQGRSRSGPKCGAFHDFPPGSRA